MISGVVMTTTVSHAGSLWPPCPLTGRPAKRRVHGFSTNVLLKAWRTSGAGDLSHLLGGQRQVALYESDTGLFYFDPMVAGDGAFYGKFYEHLRAHERFNLRLMSRVEFRHAASLIPVGARVLDVGCGSGAFAAHLAHANYVGLDPFAPGDAPDYVLRESLQEHAARKPGSYDVVTAFQVVEHMADPRGFAERCIHLLRPGGLLILCAPLHPSPLTDIPNFLLNFPPHHLTWWNCRAFAALADVLGLEPVDISELPFSPHAGIIGWLHRFSLIKTPPAPKERYFAHRWSWHFNLLLAYGLARLADRALPPPRSFRSVDVLMAARKRA
jgi:SAM-dependent methyltransferase